MTQAENRFYRTKPRGRPRTKGRLRNYKFTPQVEAVLAVLPERLGWTETKTVEQSILFAARRPRKLYDERRP